MSQKDTSPSGSPVSISSEIGRLRGVMVHLPGAEIERMVPSLMSEMLFDDILFAKRARAEHRRLQRLLGFVADEVLLLQDVLVESLAEASARTELRERLAQLLSLPAETLEALSDEPATLGAQLIEGILRPGLSKVPQSTSELYLLPPLPNAFFTRDPGAVIGGGAMLSSMATHTRLREPLLLGHILRHHPRLASTPRWFERFDADFARQAPARPRPSIEGGDVLVARDDLLLIGISERTTRYTIEQLADELRHNLDREQMRVRTILVVELPRTRAMMHLDTAFTLISAGECLIYEPAILEGQVQQAAVYELDLHREELSFSLKRSLLSALREHGMDLEPVACGGPHDPIAQQREQWTDGANAFALAPGVVLLYNRNVKTIEQLVRRGYRAIDEDDLLLGRADLELDGTKTVVLLAGHELSRARGGPRCMTWPLIRDPL